jgi:hypothetical protein
LYESRRRKPLMPRTRIGSGLLRELQLDEDRHLVGRAGSPLGSGLFQLTPNVSRSATASSLRPKRSPSYWSAIGSEPEPVVSTCSV